MSAFFYKDEPLNHQYERISITQHTNYNLKEVEPEFSCETTINFVEAARHGMAECNDSTLLTALYNIGHFFQYRQIAQKFCSDRDYAKHIYDSFQNQKFLELITIILYESTSPSIVAEVLNIIYILFGVDHANESDYLQSFVSPELIDRIFQIIDSPDILLPETPTLPECSLFGLFGTNHGIPAELFNRIRINSISAAINLIATSSDLQVFVLGNDQYIKVIFGVLENALEYDETVINGLQLIGVLLGESQHQYTVEQLQTFVIIFYRYLKYDLDPSIHSINGLMWCIRRNIDITPTIIENPEFKSIILFLLHQNDDIVMASLNLITCVYLNADRSAIDSMNDLMDWGKWKQIGLIKDNDKLLKRFIRATSAILENNWDLLQDFVDSRIFTVLSNISIDGKYDVRKEVVIMFMRLGPSLPNEIISELIGNGLISSFNELLENATEDEFQLTLDFIHHLLLSSFPTEIIANEFTEQYENIMNLLRMWEDSDNESIVVKCIELEEIIDSLVKTDDDANVR